MKKYNLFAFLIASIFLLASCGGDDDDSATPAGNSLSANVTGAISANFTVSGEVQGQKLVQANLTSSGVLSIVASGTEGHSMSIAITSYDGAGTYDLGLTSGNTMVYTNVDLTTFATTGFANTAGSIEITTSGDVISGTFSMDGEGNDGTIAASGNFSVTPENQ